MENLWTPWRMEFVAGPKPSGCIFCDKPRENKDRENLILYRGTWCFIILNRYPYNNGHLMVVPYAHLSDFSALPTDSSAEMMRLAQHCVSVLRPLMRPDGFNLGMNLGHCAGAGIADHIHLHLVPRWEGDTNFMPVLAGVRVIPELLEQTYDRLLAGGIANVPLLPGGDAHPGAEKR
jgi:ATP adenylyltransferase